VADDSVAKYCESLGFSARPRTVLVEGETDAELFCRAAASERRHTGSDLLNHEFGIGAAGKGDNGGTKGVLRELTVLKALARITLLPNGRPKYRFIGLFDNDDAGKYAVRTAGVFDSSVIEFRDVFRLWPSMPVVTNFEPSSLGKAFETENEPCKGLDWELEDLLPEGFLSEFIAETPGCVLRTIKRCDRTHRDYSRDGKAKLHRFIKDNAVHADFEEVIQIIRRLRSYMGL
jgi:hypothetical protein